jgi:nicotinamide-nucleotide amidase
VEKLGLQLAYLPSPGRVKLRISGASNDPQNKEKVDQAVDKLYRLIPEHIYGEGKDELQEVVGNLLRKTQKTLVTAESCTGGYLAHLITSVSGSSAYYIGSILAYSNAIKTRLLGVDKSSLEAFGAVSEDVVLQMARNARRMLQSDYAISTSGIAGPEGGSADKPVGTIWIGMAGPDYERAVKFQLGHSRERNIHISALWALGEIYKDLKGVLV